MLGVHVLYVVLPVLGMCVIVCACQWFACFGVCVCVHACVCVLKAKEESEQQEESAFSLGMAGVLKNLL